jgi:hypothetical protein
MGRDVNNKIRNAPKSVAAITFHMRNDLRYKSVQKVLVDKVFQTLFNTRQRLRRSLIFIDFGLSSANHTAQTVSAKELFSLVSDIALQCLCTARFERVITTRCRSPLLRRRQLPWAISCTNLSGALAPSHTTLRLMLR